MLKYLKKYRKWCLLAPIMMMGEIFMDLLQPHLMAKIVDDGVLGGDMRLILTVGIRMILLVLFGGLCGILSGVFANLAAQNYANDLRKDLFAKIMHLSFEQIDKISTGSLVTRLTNDVTQVQQMVHMSIRMVVRSGLMFLGGIFMLYQQSPRFALVAAVALPLIAAAAVIFLRLATPLFGIVQARLDGVNNVMQENVAGARVVKAYVKEEHELSRFDAASDLLCSTNLRVATILAFLSPIINVILNACVIAVIGIGGKSVEEGVLLRPGAIMAAITYLSMLLMGLMSMIMVSQTFTRALASSKRIREVLEEPVLIRDGGFDGETGEKTGEVELKNVSFSYPSSGGKKVLDGVNLTVRKGETVAVLGSTGSGKSTLVNLIPRFYDATDGEVLVDGVNVRDYDLKALREKIAIVTQKAELYCRPIEANIRWGKDSADPWEIKRAAEVAQADDFICAAPDGYYTQVSEGGHSLSGGQKQRIALSRAVLKDAEIMIFDDSTSALDLSTEAKLYRALEETRPDTTKIIIAQRIASVRGADRIAVLDNGRVAACGTHDELMQSSPVYRDIYFSQLKEDEQ